MTSDARRAGDWVVPKAAAQRVSRHTALVRHLRLAVPALAVGLVLTYGLSATPPRVDREFVSQFTSLEETSEGLKLARPRYAGEDLEGQPFEVAATSAIRSPGNEDQVGLEQPEAHRVRSDGQETTVKARDGLFNQASKTIDLSNNVTVEQTSGRGLLVLTTDAATMDLDRQVVRSLGAVHAQGDGGTVDAGRGTIYQNEDRIVLEDGVRMLLEPTSKADAEQH